MLRVFSPTTTFSGFANSDVSLSKYFKMALKNLPLGISTLSLLLESNGIYVDKTEYAFNLIYTPGRFFLSRPRRFGKSLFVDTLKEIFEGNQKLFEGLYIYDKWDWTKKYPVIKLDFAAGGGKNQEELDLRLKALIQQNKDRLGVHYDSLDLEDDFSRLISMTASKYGQRVVVLVDEYDKPMLDNLNEPLVAAEIRDALKGFYGVLKEQDTNLQFVFMTGVTKFSKVSLFSGVNQLSDITIDKRYSSICGYTDNDLQEHFSEYLAGSDPEEVKKWYNGYSWTGPETVYNPYDILLFLDKGKVFRNYWFETGNPTFLMELFKKNQYFLPDLEKIQVTEDVLDSFDVETIIPITLLFQSGYLTIVDTHIDFNQLIFTLKIPNMEVRQALYNKFIFAYTGLLENRLDFQLHLRKELSSGDVPSLIDTIKRLFASIPWRNFTNNDLAEYEGYYASVLFAFFASLLVKVIPEDSNNHGQADITIILSHHIYVMEIKVVNNLPDGNNIALEQIIQRNYAEKYRNREGMTVHEVGLVFNKTERNLVQADYVTTP
jgi:hypothetical protein